MSGELTDPVLPIEDVIFPAQPDGGSIPVLNVTGTGVAETWENSLLKLWNYGREIRTEYDRKDKDGNFIDPPSKDCTMMMTVLNPLAEPRFHRCFPGGPADLQEYRMEVIDGIKDHWVDLEDKKKWQYTYHGRLRRYEAYINTKDERGDRSKVWEIHRHLIHIDQIQKVIDHLAKSPYTRRCQAVTWQPWEDMDSSDPPCLQSCWFRIMIDESGQWWLNMNVRFRSRDAYMAAFMNMDACIELMAYVAEKVGEKAGRTVLLGRYCDLSDSYHIYGRNHEQFKREFLASIKNRTFLNRTYQTEDLLGMMEEAIPAIRAKIKKKDLG